jgi:hypothetical protein
MNSPSVPPVAVSYNLPSLSQSFSPWVQHQTWSVLAQVGAAIGGLLWVTQVVYYCVHVEDATKPLLDESILKIIVDTLHVFFISGFIVMSIRFLDDNLRGAERVKLVFNRIYHDTPLVETDESEKDEEKNGEKLKKKLKACAARLREFKLNFLRFWIGMLCLYMAFACQHAYDLVVIHNQVHEMWKQTIFPGIVFVFNNVTLIFIFACFLLMYLDQDSNAQEQRRKWWLRIFMAFVILFCLSYFVLAWANWGRDANFWEKFNSVFDALSGILNALIFALLITKLDSKLLGLRSWLICILYSYAAVQPLFAVFELTHSEILRHVTTSVLVFVFISKVYFFLIITYALQTGRMLNYFFCFPSLKKYTRYVREWSNELRAPVIIGVSTILLFSATLLYTIIPKAFQLPEIPEYAAGWLSLCQALVIIVLLILLNKDRALYRKRTAHSPEVKRVEKQVRALFVTEACSLPLEKCYEREREFNRNFMSFWGLTLALYIVMTLESSKIGDHWLQAYLGDSGTIVYPYVVFSLSVLNLLYIFRCFLLLDSPPNTEPNDDKHVKMVLNYSSLAAGLFIGLAVFVFIFVGGPTWAKPQMLDFATLIDGIAGTMSALAIALLVARMSSRWFGLSLPIICVLLLYAAIQPLFIAFAQWPKMTIAVLIAAFGLKISFFMVLRYSLRHGLVLNYLVCLPLLKKRVNSIIENQFDIRLSAQKSREFTITIAKKDELKFSSVKSFSDRAECDSFVEKFIKQLKELQGHPQDDEKLLSVFPIRKKFGTYWLELKSERDIFFESVALKSREEAEELRRESLDMIPYCKYSRL